MATKKGCGGRNRPDNVPKSEAGQDRGSNLRLVNATPEQAMRAIFKIPAAEAQRIRESEKDAKPAKAEGGAKKKVRK